MADDLTPIEPPASLRPSQEPLPPILAPEPDAVVPRRKSARLRMVGLVGVAVGLLGFGGWSYVSTLDIETTDDAQVDGNAVAIAPKVSGYVVTLAIRDNQPVRTGDLLIRIDPRDYAASRDQARAALAVAQAGLANARVNLAMATISGPAKRAQASAEIDLATANRDLAAADWRRQLALTSLATTQQAKDQASAQLRSSQATLANNKAQFEIASLVAETIATAQAAVDQAQAQVGQARAQLATADLNLADTEVRAPQDGRVTLRNVQLGSYVQPGQSLFSLVTPEVWISANFKETQLDRMRVGQKVAIRVDAYGHLKLAGHIDSMQRGTGSRFSAFPSENATGNFVKILQRVPVKIVIDSGLDPDLPLPLGASAVPSVQLR